MKLPYGLKLAQSLFRRNGYVRKRMTASYIEGGKIIVAENNFKTHPKSLARHQRIHAEHAVLRHVRKGSGKVYVYRETADGIPAMARPCPACMELLRSKGIRKVVYSIANGYACENVI